MYTHNIQVKWRLCTDHQTDVCTSTEKKGLSPRSFLLPSSRFEEQKEEFSRQNTVNQNRHVVNVISYKHFFKVTKFIDNSAMIHSHKVKSNVQCWFNNTHLNCPKTASAYVDSIAKKR